MQGDLDSVQNGRVDGQSIGINELVEKYSARVFNLAFRITGNRQDAEDVVQDTFLQVLKSLSSFRGQSQVYTWIYRIAVHASLKVKKRFGGAEWLDSLNEKIEAFREDVPDEVRQWYDDPAKAVYLQALLTEITRGCLHFMSFRLTDEQRVAYVMRNILDFSYQEIAKVLEISEGVVKSRLHRAHAKLQKYFQGRCRWLHAEQAACTCESRMGFALQLDPELLRRVRMQALRAETDTAYVDWVTRQVDDISDLYRRLPHLEYKVETLKGYLSELAKKN